MWQALIPVASSLIERLFPDPKEAERAKLELLKMEQEGELQRLAVSKELALGQVEINKAEAQTGNMFIGGWRPMIGWICAGAIGYQYIINPLVAWYAMNNGLTTPPSVPSDDLFELVMLMLGVAGLRTFEKFKGVAR
jgi:hypothetical protein